MLKKVHESVAGFISRGISKSPWMKTCSKCLLVVIFPSSMDVTTERDLHIRHTRHDQNQA